MTDFLERKRSEISARMQELKPLVDEYVRLEAAIAALQGVAVAGGSRRSAAGSNGRGARAGGGGPPRPRGRPKGSGKRAREALALVSAEPGITIAELAQRMEMNQNYLYRVLPELARSGLVVKRGRGWHPAVSE